jgi:probable rRNA maturation factor
VIAQTRPTPPPESPGAVEISWADEVSIAVDEQALLSTLGTALHDAHTPGRLHIILTDDEALKDLNVTYRGIDRPTDVLSFEMGDDIHHDEESSLGEVYISIDRARDQAAEASRPIDEEIAHLAVHGTLHVLGFEHDTDKGHAEMVQLEETYLTHWRAAVTHGAR